MTRPGSLAQAGSNESQDSQAILEAYRAEFGVPTMSSSPPADCSNHNAAGQDGDQEAREQQKVEAEDQPRTGALINGTGIAQQPQSSTNNHSVPEANARGNENDDAHQSSQTRLVQGPALDTSDPQSRDSPAAPGVALTPSQKQSASPPANTAAAPTASCRDRDTSSHGRLQTIPGSIADPANAVSHEPPAPETAPDAVAHELNQPGWAVSNNHSNHSAAVPPRRKMDFSQQTPTQVNDDRDYGEYCDVVPSSPVPDAAPMPDTVPPESHEPTTLHGEDTGAVNFGNLSDLARPSSQVSEDAGFENTRGGWRQPADTSQLHSSHAFTPYRRQGADPAAAFETPAPPKNPFAAKPSIAAPLAGSQLFGQTQLSSAIKKVSPTSSRPSPNLFNTISPNIIETSPLKNRANVSSPTNMEPSSPQGLHEVPETAFRDGVGEPIEAETPLNNRSTGLERIPESPQSSEPTPKPPKPPKNSGPMSQYEPMKRSQERKTHHGPTVSPLDEDSDSDDATRKMERRKKVERKRAKAAEELGKVSFMPRKRRHSDEELSKKKRMIGAERTSSVADLRAQGASYQDATAVAHSQTVITQSNESLPVESTRATPRESQPEVTAAPQEDDAMVDVNKEDAQIPLEQEDMIPATSPAPSMPDTAPPAPNTNSEPELPTLPGLDEEVAEPEQRDPEPSSLPVLRKPTNKTYGRALQKRRRNTVISSSNSELVTADLSLKTEPTPSVEKEQDAAAIASDDNQTGLTDETADNVVAEASDEESKTPKNSKPALPPPMTTRSRGRGSRPITPVGERSAAAAPSTSSSLSILSTTPVPSAKTTPGTQQESPADDRPGSVALPSPAGKRNLRKRDPRASVKSESPQPTRMSKRLRLESESTDELAYSPSASVLEAHAKTSRSFRQSLVSVHRTGRLFEGMVFAISFQNDVPTRERTRLETKIKQAGGTILSDGFRGLFQPSSVMHTSNPVIDGEDALRVTKANAENGFTALIADSHSRKAKYLQALALGLPCLATQWITACVNRGAVLDWEPYLLCAGASAVLGDAIRSRTLAPYSAADAMFIETIEQRRRLFDGQRVLVVTDPRKARNDAKEPYTFLATVLGASISRVFTMEQARDALLEHRKAGNPFQWVYADETIASVNDIVAKPDPPARKGRKKPAPKSTATTDKTTRLLTNEVVVQSLILGRMVEEDELKF